MDAPALTLNLLAIFRYAQLCYVLNKLVFNQANVGLRFRCVFERCILTSTEDDHAQESFAESKFGVFGRTFLER